ncbi:MAG: hypothetical protein MUC41_09480 [Syntrophobacteraceae bacterium]|jgi:hypothetical protein|nr:hypothetical protein [Syntrophobacteraceae bacterium]
MLRDWILEIQPEPHVLCAVRVAVRGEARAAGGALLASCSSLDELREEIARMKVELDGVLESALQKLAASEKGGGSRVDDPARIWKEMESMPGEREMFDHFNGFSVSDREIIAEYVLTHVNMFKGRGPVFSEHYDSDRHLLE